MDILLALFVLWIIVSLCFEVFKFKPKGPTILNPKNEVKARAGGKCERCGSWGDHVHHIVPVFKGGSDTLSNMLFLCVECHALEHGRPLDIIGWHKYKRIRDERITLREQTARKMYGCEVCSRTITPGETYLYGRGYYSTSSVHVCLRCAQEYEIRAKK